MSLTSNRADASVHTKGSKEEKSIGPDDNTKESGKWYRNATLSPNSVLHFFRKRKVTPGVNSTQIP